MTEAHASAVLIKRRSGWAEVVLSRPERKNAITGPLGIALAAALHELADDTGVHLVLLRGAGGAFCSGLDLGEFNAEPAPAWLGDFQQIWRGAHRALFQFPKPIVGALERYAINGGAALAIACDLLVAGEQAFLQVGEVKLGMAAPYNLAWLGLRHAEAVNAEIALLGERLTGPELLRLGVAQRCVADAAVLDEARALCERLAGYPAGALARIKTGLRARLEEGADAWFDRFTTAGAPPPMPPPRPTG
jgi:enoyl-CoA hydratase/carnithine racemase